MASGSSSVVENSHRHPKVEGSSLGTVVGARREKTAEKRLRYLATPLLKTASTLLISHEYRMSGYNVVVAVILSWCARLFAEWKAVGLKKNSEKN